jgi:hypothetical protein
MPVSSERMATKAQTKKRERERERERERDGKIGGLES